MVGHSRHTPHRMTTTAHHESGSTEGTVAGRSMVVRFAVTDYVTTPINPTLVESEKARRLWLNPEYQTGQSRMTGNASAGPTVARGGWQGPLVHDLSGLQVELTPAKCCRAL